MCTYDIMFVQLLLLEGPYLSTFSHPLIALNVSYLSPVL